MLIKEDRSEDSTKDRQTQQFFETIRGGFKDLLGIDDRKEAGMIYLHGLGPSFDGYCKLFSAQGFGLRLSNRKTKYVCPRAPMRGVALIPPTMWNILVWATRVRSWFDFKLMPEFAVKALLGIPGEDVLHLEEARATVEAEIETMIQEGIPSENIVVAGMSQVNF